MLRVTRAFRSNSSRCTQNDGVPARCASMFYLAHTYGKILRVWLYRIFFFFGLAGLGYGKIRHAKKQLFGLNVGGRVICFLRFFFYFSEQFMS